ncbi:DUF11 domain-containing protein [Microbacterium sp. W2R]|nr:DUF11 domain-containing protein [Microbacterium nymphoidis]MCD2498457.1 DUF11 domain-containing protein [Microbacterium nymphoidis]
MSYNAIGFNPADNFIYGIVAAGQGTAAFPDGALVRVGQNGVTTRVGSVVYTHPVTNSVRWYAGAFNPANGYFYISDSGPNTTVRAIRVSDGAIMQTINLGQAPGVQDFAFKDGFAWGANNSGDVRRINLSTGAIDTFPNVLADASGGYGAVWNFGNGNLGFSSNVDGIVTQLQITNGATATPSFDVISTVRGPISNLNDGTSILGLPADLEIEKTGPAVFESGDRLTYEITVTNNGAGVSSGWTVTDTLPAGLSNATVVGNVTSSITGSEVTVSGGRLGIGESASFRVEADSNVAPGACITNVASVFGNEEDPDESNNEATAESCDQLLLVEKTSDATADSRPGDVINYTVTATNAGEGPFTAANPAVVFDDLSGVLDDASYNGDAQASVSGSLGYQAPLLSWSGALPVGGSVVISYSVTLQPGGDGDVANVTWVPDDPGVTTPPTCDPATDGIDDVTGQACATEQFDLPRLTINKIVDRTDLPAIGEQATFTITVHNDGPGVYTATSPATATDDLSDVLDDSTFDDASLTADVGSVSRTGSTISWSGALAAGETATITYAVTYTGEGDQILRNQACIPADDTLPGAASCADVQVPGALLTQWKTAEPSSSPVVAGSTITYTLHFKNDGKSAADVDAVDSLIHVVDDAAVSVEPTSADGLTAVRAGVQIYITGSVPAGETYTVTYTVTVRPDLQRGDSVATNFLLKPGETPPTDGQCTPTDAQLPNCTSTPITGITYAKSVVASESPVRAGTELTYTITATNIGATVVDVERDDYLADVLDDATVTGVPSSDTPSVSVNGPTDDVVEIRGTLAVGATATVTYTVTVKEASQRGNSSANNFLMAPGSTPPEECRPPFPPPGPWVPGRPFPTAPPYRCTVTPIQGFMVAKSADQASVLPGDMVTYTVTVTNTGAVDYTTDAPASFSDDLSGVLDDATYNGDASSGATVAGDTLTWSGPLAIGETVQVTYSVTVNDPLTGDQNLANAVVPTGPTGECDPEGECATNTPVASYIVSKTADQTSVLPGDVVTYTVTVTNTGDVDYTVSEPASFSDDLSGVLDDATYNGDASNGATVSGNTLAWSGPLSVGETVDVTYSVTVNDPLTGDQNLANAVVPTTPGGSCDPEGECTTTTPVASYTVSKTADQTSVLPGGVVTYTVTVTNTGDVDYTVSEPASFSDDLSGVLDDATYNGDASNGATVSGNTLTWSGPLPVGGSRTITYSVTVDSTVTGDFTLRNAVVPTSPGGGCATDGECTTTTPVQALSVVKTTSATSVLPGEVIDYTITVTNIGQLDYTDAAPASFSDDLSRVLDDATYNGDATSSSGAGIGYEAPTLSWSGPLAVGETVTVTYSVTVNDPASGDGQLNNTVVTPPNTGGNCEEGSTDPSCVANVPAGSYTVLKEASQETALPGDVVTYTITITNTGQVDYTDAEPASFSDDLTRVLDDARYNGDVSAGGSVDGSTLRWSGPLAVGETLQVTYSVTVDDPVRGDFQLRNVVAPTSPGGACVEGGCVTQTEVASYTVSKTADTSDVVLGGRVTYTLTVSNTGQVPYTTEMPASVSDDMSGVLDDATYNGDASAGAEVAGDTLRWSGALGVGESVTVTYSVTVNSPATGDGVLRNAVVSDGPGGGCAEAGGCVTETPVASFTVAKTVSTQRATIGERVTFSILVTNTGAMDYTEERPATFTDDLSSVLEHARYNNDATSGAVYEQPVLSWAGALPAGESVTITYSVTTRSAGEMRNVVVTPPEVGANCSPDSDDADCRTVTTVTPPLPTTGTTIWTGGALLGIAVLALGFWLIARRRAREVNS